MRRIRVASLLPSATEMLYALGAREAVCAVTCACPQPEGAAPKPRIVEPAINTSGMGGRRIDGAVSALAAEGGEAFRLDAGALRRARPDLVVCQDACSACAIDGGQAGEAVAPMGADAPEIYRMDPRGVGGVLDCVTELAGLLGMEEAGRRLRRSLEARIARVEKAVAGRRRPGVLALEWVDPPYSAGHWVPEMIRIAGGRSLAGEAGGRSRRIGIAEAAAADPEIAVLMPCGFDAGRAAAEYRASGLAADAGWRAARAAAAGEVHAVDAGAHFSMAGVSTVTGIEVLAGIIHPGAAPAGSGPCLRVRS